MKDKPIFMSDAAETISKAFQAFGIKAQVIQIGEVLSINNQRIPAYDWDNPQVISDTFKKVLSDNNVDYHSLIASAKTFKAQLTELLDKPFVFTSVNATNAYFSRIATAQRMWDDPIVQDCFKKYEAYLSVMQRVTWVTTVKVEDRIEDKKWRTSL